MIQPSTPLGRRACRAMKAGRRIAGLPGALSEGGTNVEQTCDPCANNGGCDGQLLDAGGDVDHVHSLVAALYELTGRNIDLLLDAITQSLARHLMKMQELTGSVN
jgi:hypothetical protein